MGSRSFKVVAESDVLSDKVTRALADTTYATHKFSAEQFPIHFEIDGNTWRVFKSHISADVKKRVTELVRSEMAGRVPVYL
jgi:hypothetical protein